MKSKLCQYFFMGNCQQKGGIQCPYNGASEQCPADLPAPIQALIAEAESLHNRLVVTHELFSDTVDFDIHEQYEKLLADYASVVYRIRLHSPQLISATIEQCKAEASSVWERIEAASCITYPGAREEVDRLVARHVRLFDQIWALEG